MNKLTLRQLEILNIIETNNAISISKIRQFLSHKISTPSLNRDLGQLLLLNYILRHGTGRSIYYSLSSFYKVLKNYDLENYFKVEVDLRKGNKAFNFDIYNILSEVEIFNTNEIRILEDLKNQYQANIKNLSKTIYQKELERLTIELSWKSSQIEGNTYSLLETERLLIDKEAVDTKSKDEAIMLINHKITLDYILANKHESKRLTLKYIEEIHSLLIKDLGVSRNIRSTPVGIIGSTYVPLDNGHQIRENLEKMCDLINNKENIFEKALLSLLLISYIQPFEDGNKRVSRMISTAILDAHGACPLSYRSVSAFDYKKSILLFYEQNNITAFKNIFMEQSLFACKNYFL